MFIYRKYILRENMCLSFPDNKSEAVHQRLCEMLLNMLPESVRQFICQTHCKMFERTDTG